jgi:cell division protein FtsL
MSVPAALCYGLLKSWHDMSGLRNMGASMGALRTPQEARPGSVTKVPGSSFWLAFSVLLGLVTASGLGVVYTTYTSRHLLNSLQLLENQRNRLQVEWGKLLLEQSSLVAQGRVEDMAIAELGMEVPDLEQVVVFTSD